MGLYDKPRVAPGATVKSSLRDLKSYMYLQPMFSEALALTEMRLFFLFCFKNFHLFCFVKLPYKDGGLY